MAFKILVVDNEKSHCRMLSAVLSEAGFEVTIAGDGVEAVAAVGKRPFDIVLMDIRMPRMGGIEALKQIREKSPEVVIIIMTAYASVGTAVEALKSGAHDYLTKPLDIEELKLLVNKALDHKKLQQENRLLKERLGMKFGFDNIIGESKSMKALFETLSLVAPSEAAVLIQSESGTGKELIANAIHENSLRSDNPFIKVNCAALPEPLLESELFGHEKGAFTGAVRQKQGRFLLADTGSVFLDEIGEMPLSIQAKMLRVLQEKEFSPVGSSKTVKVDIRIIAATNKNLEEEISKKRFREDLFYRLNVVNVMIPCLRERLDDIMLLADFFLEQYTKKNNRLIRGFSPATVDLLKQYHWPGNVRELENAVERAVILARGEWIQPGDLPESMVSPDRDRGRGDATPGRSLKEMEKQMILRTLEETGGNRTRAAGILGISRRTLQLRLKEYGLNP